MSLKTTIIFGLLLLISVVITYGGYKLTDEWSKYGCDAENCSYSKINDDFIAISTNNSIRCIIKNPYKILPKNFTSCYYTSSCRDINMLSSIMKCPVSRECFNDVRFGISLFVTLFTGFVSLIITIVFICAFISILCENW